jgi:hypothetical protein
MDSLCILKDIEFGQAFEATLRYTMAEHACAEAILCTTQFAIRIRENTRMIVM